MRTPDDSHVAEKENDCRKYYIPNDIKGLIKNDEANIRVWSQVLAAEPYADLKDFLEKITEQDFLCPICQDMVKHPVTTSCAHNICLPCTQRTLKFYGSCCPTCRSPLGDEFKVTVNKNLVKVLQRLIPSYSSESDVDFVQSKKHKSK
jgi:hypothetical protein